MGQQCVLENVALSKWGVEGAHFEVHEDADRGQKWIQNFLEGGNLTLLKALHCRSNPFLQLKQLLGSEVVLVISHGFGKCPQHPLLQARV